MTGILIDRDRFTVFICGLSYTVASVAGPTAGELRHQPPAERTTGMARRTSAVMRLVNLEGGVPTIASITISRRP